jgi:hypothetical protein
MNLNVPEPEFKYSTAKLKKAYKEATKSIMSELNRLDVTDLSRANTMAALANVSEILSGLDKESAEWVEENIPKAAREGVARAIVNLGVAETLEQAEGLINFNRPNQRMISAAVADTQSDLLAVTSNISRKTRATVRKVMASATRENMAAGINGRKSIKRDVVAGLRKELGKAVDTGIIDASGRRWKPEVYAEMITNTKMSEVFDEANRNESIQRGALYAVISGHGAKDACKFHEGRIIKLTADAPGNYPTYESLKASGQIWHPNCKHHYSTVRNPDNLPDSVKDRAEKQDKLGREAIATGKRNVNDAIIAANKNQGGNSVGVNISQLTNEADIVKAGGKVASGDKLLTKTFGGGDFEEIDLRMAQETKSALKGRYRGTANVRMDFMDSWTDDNNNPLSLGLESYFAEKYNLPYVKNNVKKLTERERAVADFMQEQTVSKLRDEGITHVKVYRGVMWDEDNRWLPQDEKDMTIKGRALSSWTMRKGVATEYADYVDDEDGNMFGGVIEAIIPIDKIGFAAIIGYADEIVAVGDIKGANLIAKKRTGGRW